jgi:membrane-associated protease RseP (regulator of RpoE activity)
MRPALPAALAASTLFAGLFAGESVLAQSLLSQLEQRIQGTQGPAAGGAGPSSAGAAAETGYLGAVLDEAGENRGVRVNSVRPDAPAATGGLQGGDLIKSIDGKPIKNLDDLDAVLNHAGPGQKVQFGVQRDNRQQQVTVTLGKRPAAASTTDDNAGGPAASASPSPSLSPPAAATPGAPSLSPPGPFGAPAGAPAPLEATPGAPPSALSPSIGTLPSTTLPSTAPSPGAEAITPPATTITPGLSSPSGGRFGSFGSQPSAGAGSPPSSGLASQPPAQPLDLGPPPGSSPSTALPAFQPPRSFSSPSAGGAIGGHASLGITVEPLTPQTRSVSAVPAQSGAIITQIKPGSPAEQAGLPVNAVIVQADGKRINSADDLVRFIQAAQPGQEVELTYYEGSQIVRRNVRLGEAGPASSSGMPVAGAGSRGTARGSLSAPATTSPSGGVGGTGIGGTGIGGAGAGGMPPSAGTGSSRPLLSRIEGIADRVSRGNVAAAPRGTALSTVYDPYQMAALQRSVEELTGTIRSLEQRLAAIEARVGVTPAADAAGAAPTGDATSGAASPGTVTPGSFGPTTVPGNP